MAEKGIRLLCTRRNCIANKDGECLALYKKAKIEPTAFTILPFPAYTHSIDDEYITNCPFFLDKEMEEKDLAKLKMRLGINGRRRRGGKRK